MVLLSFFNTLQMALSAHQEKVMEDGLNILKMGDRLLVKGSAGVGKTYMMNEFIKRYNQLWGGEVVCAAPTNKAVAVLKGKVDKGLAKFSTLASALKIRRKVNNATGEVTFEPVYSRNNRPLDEVDILFLDEASMVNEQNHLWLEEHAELMGVILVYIGDHKQLPPVKEKKSPVFLGKPEVMSIEESKSILVEEDQTLVTYPKKDMAILYTKYPEVELTEIVRQGEGNPVIDLSRNMNLARQLQDTIVPTPEGMAGYIFTMDRNKVVDTLATVNGSDKLKYIAYTNADVDKMNIDVRNLIYGNPQKVEVGESLIFNSPYGDMYYNSQEIKVETLNIVWQKFSIVKSDDIEEFELRVYVINGKEIHGRWLGVFVIHEHSEGYLKKLGYQLKKEAGQRKVSYQDKDEFFNQFADIKYNHALTVHKAQGSTFEQVIVNMTNLNTIRDKEDKECLLYTAFTRTSRLLILAHLPTK